jgi:protein phosphatase
VTTLAAGSATDVGLVRAVNQDHLLVASPLFAVADGMGGHAAGEVASETALEALRRAIAAELGDGRLTASGMADAVHGANRAVWDEAQADPHLHGMGTTLTAVAVVEDEGRERLAVANVGDSRTYRLREGRLEQLTVDHSLVAELVAEGQIRPDEAESHPQRHVLTRALGVYPDVEVDVLTAELQPADRLLLCSDGLSRELTDEQIASLLRRFADPTEAARELVANAKRNGGNDNITAVVVDVLAGAVPTGAAPAPTGAAPAPTDADASSGGANSAVGVESIATPVPVGAGGASRVVTPAGAAADDTQAVDLAAVRAAVDTPPTDTPPTDTPPTDTPPTDAGQVEAPAGEAGRRARRHSKRPDLGPRNRVVTPRVVLFFLLVVALLGLAYGGTAWYARSSYFVGVHRGRLTIYQGRPGGVLWWNPTITEVTGVTNGQVESLYLPGLRKGVQESSLGAARAYVANLRRRALDAGIGASSSSVPSGAPARGGLGEGLLL